MRPRRGKARVTSGGQRVQRALLLVVGRRPGQRAGRLAQHPTLWALPALPVLPQTLLPENRCPPGLAGPGDGVGTGAEPEGAALLALRTTAGLSCRVTRPWRGPAGAACARGPRAPHSSQRPTRDRRWGAGLPCVCLRGTGSTAGGETTCNLTPHPPNLGRLRPQEKAGPECEVIPQSSVRCCVTLSRGTASCLSPKAGRTGPPWQR